MASQLKLDFVAAYKRWQTTLKPEDGEELTRLGEQYLKELSGRD